MTKRSNYSVELQEHSFQKWHQTMALTTVLPPDDVKISNDLNLLSCFLNSKITRDFTAM